MKASSKQIGYLKGLIKQQGMEPSTEELNKLTSIEASRMIQALRGDRDTPEKKMKRKIISMAITINWTVGKGRIDMKALNSWCEKRGMYHKPLDEHNILELPHLVSQFQQGPLKSKLSKAHA